MKKLILFLCLIICANYVFSQYPQPYQNLGGLNVAVRDTGGLFVRQTFVPPVFSDTTAANVSNKTKNYPASFIFTTSDNTYWGRNAALTKWLSVSKGASNISILNDSTLLICNINSCDTFVLNNIAINNFTILNDSTMQVCNVSGVCDTININPTSFNKTYVDSVKVTNSSLVDTIKYYINGVAFSGGFINRSLRDTIYAQLPLFIDTTLIPGRSVIRILQDDGLVSVGIVTWSGIGLTYDVTSAVYVIGGKQYTSPATQITLDPADLIFPRVDLFAVDTTANAIKITGTPAAIPLVPQVAVGGQIALTTGQRINVGDTVPSNITMTVIYNENVEWITGTQGGGASTVNFNSTANPFRNTKSAFVSSYETDTQLYFINGAYVRVTPTTDMVLNLHIYFNGKFDNYLYAIFYDTASLTGEIYIDSQYGLNRNDSNQWQNISIPLKDIQWKGSGKFTTLILALSGADISGAKGFYLDYINLQQGIQNIPPPSDYSNKLDSITITKTTVGADTSNYVLQWIKGLSYPVGTIWTGGTGGGSSQRFGIEDNLGIQDRSVNMGNNFLAITGSGNDLLNVISSGNASAISADAVGNGIGVSVNSTSNYGVFSNSNGNYAGGFNRLGIAGSNTILPSLSVISSVVGGIGLDEIGTSLDFQVSTANAGIKITNRLISKWTTADDATRTSLFQLSGYNNATQHFLTFPSLIADRYSPISVNNNFADAAGNITVATGGGGSTNSNIGAGYRLAVPTTNNIKTLFNGYAIGIDSASNTNALTLKADTVLLLTKLGAAAIYQPIISGEALTKTDDTNVTLTLGGTPTTALLKATSMSLGWTGTLAATRGGTGTGTVATGDLLYGSGVNTWGKLAAGSNTQVLTLAGGVPTWATPAAAGTDSAIWKNDATYTGVRNLTLGTLATNYSQAWTKTAIVGGTASSEAIILQNTTAAINGTQQNSPSLKFRGYGWGTTASTSQSVDWLLQSAVAQGSVPAGVLHFYHSVNGATPTSIANLNPSSSGIFSTAYFIASGGVQATSISSSGQVIGGLATLSGQQYRLVNGGGTTNPFFMGTNGTTTAGTLSWGYDATNQMTFHARNASSASIARASVGLVNLVNTAASESADLAFNTERTAGAAVSESMRLTSAGALGIGGTPNAAALLDITSTTKGLLLPRMTKTQRDAIASPVAGLAVYQTDNTPGLRVFNGTNWIKYTEATD